LPDVDIRYEMFKQKKRINKMNMDDMPLFIKVKYLIWKRFYTGKVGKRYRDSNILIGLFGSMGKRQIRLFCLFRLFRLI
jgi:hypothetical protein